MFNKSLFVIEKPGQQFFFLLTLIVTCFFIVLVMGMVFGTIFFGKDILYGVSITSENADPHKVNMMKYLQIISQLGLFIIPALVFAKLNSPGLTAYYGFRKKTHIVTFLIISSVILLSSPVISLLMDWNMQLTLPESLKSVSDWFSSTEESAGTITAAFFADTSAIGIAVNILMIAIIPAVGEELLFRGCLQQIFVRWTGKKHLAVILAALIFAAFHIQFLSFLPRFALGLFLGYIFLWTGNLWTSILAHFINNISSVIVATLYYSGKINVPMDDFGSIKNPILLIVNVLILTFLIAVIYYREKAKTEILSN